MKILSLFDGMSVAQQALKGLNKEVEVYYASEIDEYAMAVTQSNFPSTVQLGSVTKVSGNLRDVKEQIIILNDIDLLIGGSPCQDLSIAKKNRQGLKGVRSGLFYEYVRIRDEVKPKYFILENVNSMPKEAKEQISEILGVQPVMINASLVSAQNRKRLFWVGKWNGEKYEQVEISQPEDRGILLKDILEIDVDEKYQVIATQLNMSKQFGNSESDKGKAFTLRASNPNGIKLQRIGQIGKGGQGDRIYSPEGKSVGLSALGGGRGAKTGLYAIDNPLKGKTKYGWHYEQGVYGKNGKTRALKASSGSGNIPKLVCNCNEGGDCPACCRFCGNYNSECECTQDDFQIRKLTPTECLRLQSMPDDYFDKAEYKKKPISNTQRYKMCGNAFNCEVIMHILKQIL